MKARGAGDDDDDANDDDAGNDEVGVVIERAKGIILINCSMTHGIVNTSVNQRRENKNMDQNVEETNLFPMEKIRFHSEICHIIVRCSSNSVNCSADFIV